MKSNPANHGGRMTDDTNNGNAGAGKENARHEAGQEERDDGITLKDPGPEVKSNLVT